MITSTPTSSVTRYILIAIALVAVAALFWKVIDVFVVAFGAIVFATVLSAGVAPLQRKTGLSRRWSLAIVVVSLVLIAGALSWLFGKQASNQFVEMRERLPAATEKARDWLAGSKFGQAVVDTLKEAASGGDTLANSGVALGAILGGVGNVLLILFAGIYFAADPKMYRDGALRLLPPSRRGQVGRALDDAGVSLQKWLVAQLIVMAAVGLMTGIGLALLHVPLSLSLGLLAALFEFVPVVGPIAAAVPAVLLAFATGPDTALHVILLYIAVQQIESNVLTPLLQRWAVDLPPVVALLSIVACGLLFGIVGVVFATPMAVVALAMVKHLYVEDTLENGREHRQDRRRRRPPHEIREAASGE